MHGENANSFFNPITDLVYSLNKEGGIESGGYKINNTLLQTDGTLFVRGDNSDTPHKSKSKQVSVSSFSELFEDMAVPAGLFMMPSLFKPTSSSSSSSSSQKGGSKLILEDSSIQSGIVPSDLYDRLLDLVSPDKRVVYDHKTRRKKTASRSHSQNPQNQKKKTRRHK